jgi:4-hydroxybutyryl-CoA dehydratase/vinylacetyl-CoA-Delta-isomerase
VFFVSFVVKKRGLLGTMPSDADFASAEVGPWCRKYLAPAAPFPPEHRQRMLRLIEAMTLGSLAVGYLVESMQGAGPPQTQRIVIQRYADLEGKKALARRLRGIDPDAWRPEERI